MGGIYEVRRREGLRCHDIHTKFHGVSGNQKLIGGGYTHKQHGDRISLLFIFSKYAM
jgi:hypothetical protein